MRKFTQWVSGEECSEQGHTTAGRSDVLGQKTSVAGRERENVRWGLGPGVVVTESVSGVVLNPELVGFL